MYTYGQFMLIYGKNHHNIVIILQLKKKFFLRNRAGGCVLPKSRVEVPQRGEGYFEEAVVDVPGVCSALSSWVPGKGGEKAEFKMPVLQ